MYKRINWLVILFAVICLFCAPSDSHTQEYDWAALDEESFESFPPTGKIMDAIGITEGMTVGEVGAGGESNVIIRTAEQAGYRLVKLETFMPQDDIYVFELKSP